MKNYIFLNKATKELQEDIERELLFSIIMDLRESKLTVGQAEQLASEYLKILPAESKEELLGKLQRLALTSYEAWQTYKKIALPYFEERRELLLEEVSQYIKEGRLDDALGKIKEEISYE